MKVKRRGNGRTIEKKPRPKAVIVLEGQTIRIKEATLSYRNDPTSEWTVAGCPYEPEAFNRPPRDVLYNVEDVELTNDHLQLSQYGQKYNNLEHKAAARSWRVSFSQKQLQNIWIQEFYDAEAECDCIQIRFRCNEAPEKSFDPSLLMRRQEQLDKAPGARAMYFPLALLTREKKSSSREYTLTFEKRGRTFVNAFGLNFPSLIALLAGREDWLDDVPAQKIANSKDMSLNEWIGRNRDNAPACLKKGMEQQDGRPAWYLLPAAYVSSISSHSYVTSKEMLTYDCQIGIRGA